MFRFCLRLFSRQIPISFVLSCAIITAILAPASSNAQRSKGALDQRPEDQPAFSQFKGVKIGMVADEARKKLGSPREKSAEQDFYVFNDNEVVQVYYDKGGTVNAISIDYMNGASSIPSSKDVFGADTAAKADGSVYKMVRYPKAGYWVSYSRTAGNEATVTITMQKIQ